jgi:hypothetical protein
MQKSDLAFPGIFKKTKGYPENQCINVLIFLQSMLDFEHTISILSNFLLTASGMWNVQDDTPGIYRVAIALCFL